MYLGSGLIHFFRPELYTGLIPDYLPDHMVLVIFSGVIEFIASLIFLFGSKYWRSVAALAFIFMLLFFFMVHVEYIRDTDCGSDTFCPRLMIGWFRLIIVQPIFIWWAAYYAKDLFKKKKDSGRYR